MDPFIRISALRKTYIMGRVQVHALDGVDMDIPPNSFMVVMGPSGSGKSTLLHIIGGLEPVTRGRVLLDGRDLARIVEPELTRFRRDKVGVVFPKHLPLRSILLLR